MHNRTVLQTLLIFMWCLSESTRRTVVSAQPTVTAWIVTPEADRKEGGRVEMRCVATNLEADHVVEWATEDPPLTLRWGDSTLSGNNRFMFETKRTANREITQEFNITDLQRGDTDEYICNINDPIASGGSLIAATAKVNLTVLYFPSESFPICSPDGPITADIGTQLMLQCSFDANHSTQISMEVSPHPINSKNYSWEHSSIDDMIISSLDLTVNATDNNVTFTCIVSSEHFPGKNSSCTIGPITVDDSTPSIVAYVAGAVGALVLIILILVVISWRRGLCNIPTKLFKSNSDPDTNTTQHPEQPLRHIYSQPEHQSRGDPSHQSIGNYYHDPHDLIQTHQSPREQAPSAITQADLGTGQQHELPQHSRQGELTTEPGFANSSFVSDETSPKIAPTPRTVPPKPKLHKPKPNRQDSIEDNTLNLQDDWMSSPPTPASEPPSRWHSIPHDSLYNQGGPKEAPSSPARQLTSYAEVSYPKKERTGRRVRSDDHVIYADLDLKSESSEEEDGGANVPSTLTT